MAEATAPTTAAETEAPARKKRPLGILIGVAVALAAGGGGAAWWFSGHASKPPPVPVVVPAQYLALDPPFVVNFEAEQLVRFLQITVQVMSRDPKTIELLKSNDPVVRNELLMLFANQKYATLATREGKEALRQQALASVRKVLKDAGGDPQHLEAVYFTTFVMQ
jgi:flagellar protein FliL